MFPFAISIVISVLTPSLAAENALHIAIREKNEDEVGRLVRNPVLLNEKDASGFSPFHRVLTEGTDKMVELFMDATGVDYELATDTGLSPLHLALEVNRTPFMPFLIAEGAKIEAVDADHGYSALHYAAFYKNVLAIRLLLKTCNNEVLEQRAKMGETALHVAAETLNGTPCLQELLEKLQVDASNYDGETALHIASRKGKSMEVKLLLSKGADIEMENNSRQKPLDIALGNGPEWPHCFVIRALVTLGADIGKKEAAIFNMFYAQYRNEKTFQNFDEEIMTITDQMFKNYPEAKTEMDLVNVYELQDTFALYRVVRSLKENTEESLLEKRRKEFLKTIEHLSSTYAPVHAPHYDKWVKERFAANLALASFKLKVHVEEKDMEPYLREVLSQRQHPWLMPVAAAKKRIISYKNSLKTPNISDRIK